MKFFVVVLSLAVTVYARPDVSLLSGSYLPGSGIGGDNGFTQGSFLRGATSGLGGPGAVGGGYSLGGANLLGGGNLGGGFIGGHGIGGNGLIQDQKHAYFYSAPEEYEQSRLRIYVAPNSARNTKVIFVKAPSYGAVKPEIIAPPSHTEDKTLVYVLVKKPEHGGSITIPSTLTSKPTKPEVFFIKYKTQQEAEQAIAGGLQQQAVGPSVPELGNQQSFVRTLQQDISPGLIGNGVGGNIVGDGIVGSGDISGSNLLGGVSGGSNLLGGISGGSDSGIVTGSGKYGPAGASGPYRR